MTSTFVFFCYFWSRPSSGGTSIGRTTSIGSSLTSTCSTLRNVITYCNLTNLGVCLCVRVFLNGPASSPLPSFLSPSFLPSPPPFTLSRICRSFRLNKIGKNDPTLHSKTLSGAGGDHLDPDGAVSPDNMTAIVSALANQQSEDESTPLACHSMSLESLDMVNMHFVPREASKQATISRIGRERRLEYYIDSVQCNTAISIKDSKH